MSILYLILGFIALSLFSVVVLPIIVAVFFVGVAGVVAKLGGWKMRKGLSPRLRGLSLEEAT
jgi:hypothetical protein